MSRELVMMAGLIGFVAGAAVADAKRRSIPVWGGLGYLLFPAIGTVACW